jgi:ATP-dependent exoDNAse (exonuclease V) alpha subunit
MAIFRLQINSIARGDEHSSVGAAAYRAGERIRDDRTNEVHNHSRRKDVTHSEIMLPGDLAGQNMDWALNRASLWNSVENAESRKNARVATEIQVTLPFELAPERRLAMARTFSQEVADHYKVAVDLAVHDPRPSGDPRNFHAHLLLTTREVSAAGLGPKAGLNLQTSERIRLGLPNISQEFTAIRERWAMLTNDALREANIEARVDHRSLAEQGIDREPKPHIPFAAYKIERAGKHSEVAESIRADYNARVQARLERAAAPTPTPTPEPTPPSAPKSLEDVRREARENWLKMRAEQSAESRTATSPAHQSAATRTATDLGHPSPAAHGGTGSARPHNTPSPHTTPAHEDDYEP